MFRKSSCFCAGLLSVIFTKVLCSADSATRLKNFSMFSDMIEIFGKGREYSHAEIAEL